jgi:CheY-like chemotaxis protein
MNFGFQRSHPSPVLLSNPIKGGGRLQWYEFSSTPARLRPRETPSGRSVGDCCVLTDWAVEVPEVPGTHYSRTISCNDGQNVKTATTRVLIVDDFQPFRILVTSLLSGNGYVFYEASDGLEAVAKAQELQPDSVLLDIHLPKLNGLEVARRLCKLVPSSRIVFFTLESSAEVVQEALRLGAWGYVAKRRAKADLLAAVTAVLQGTRFISSGLLND